MLAGGSINTPQLLLLSGIGARDELDDQGIDVVHHLPGVRSDNSVPTPPPYRKIGIRMELECAGYTLI